MKYDIKLYDIKLYDKNGRQKRKGDKKSSMWSWGMKEETIIFLQLCLFYRLKKVSLPFNLSQIHLQSLRYIVIFKKILTITILYLF